MEASYHVGVGVGVMCLMVAVVAAVDGRLSLVLWLRELELDFILVGDCS